MSSGEDVSWSHSTMRMPSVSRGMSEGTTTFGIPEELREAARMDGASEWKMYRHVIFPQLSPVALSALIIVGHMSLKVFDLIK